MAWTGHSQNVGIAADLGGALNEPTLVVDATGPATLAQTKQSEFHCCRKMRFGWRQRHADCLIKSAGREVRFGSTTADFAIGSNGLGVSAPPS